MWIGLLRNTRSALGWEHSPELCLTTKPVGKQKHRTTYTIPISFVVFITCRLVTDTLFFFSPPKPKTRTWKIKRASGTIREEQKINRSYRLRATRPWRLVSPGLTTLTFPQALTRSVPYESWNSCCCTPRHAN